MTVDISIYDEEIAPKELEDVGSFNHSYVQAELVYQFRKTGDFTVVTELSLDTAALTEPQLKTRFKEEIKPDVALYSKRSPNFYDDILRMSEMPLLAVEILSPMQATLKLLRKVTAYFELGVKSCWVVFPLTQSISVYTSPTDSHLFAQHDVLHDATLDISIPMTEIFG